MGKDNLSGLYDLVMTARPGDDGEYSQDAINAFYKTINGGGKNATKDFSASMKAGGEEYAHKIRMALNDALEETDIPKLMNDQTMSSVGGGFGEILVSMGAKKGLATGSAVSMTQDIFNGLVKSNLTTSQIEARFGGGNKIVSQMVDLERRKMSGITEFGGLVQTNNVEILENKLTQELVGGDKKKLAAYQQAASAFGLSSTASMNDIIAAGGDLDKASQNAFAINLFQAGVKADPNELFSASNVAAAKLYQSKMSVARVTDALGRSINTAVKSAKKGSILSKEGAGDKLYGFLTSEEFKTTSFEKAKNRFIQLGGEEMMQLDGYKDFAEYADKNKGSLSKEGLLTSIARASASLINTMGPSEKRGLLASAAYELTSSDKQAQAVSLASKALGRDITYLANNKFKDSDGSIIDAAKLEKMIDRFDKKLEREEGTNAKSGPQEKANAVHPAIISYWNNNFSM